jgi:transposase
MGRFDLTDEEWAVIAPHLPKKGRGPQRVYYRRVLNGVFYIRRAMAGPAGTLRPTHHGL